MPNYQQGKIYTIRCRTDDTLIYVGSTIQPLSKRWGEHKVHSKQEKCKNRVIYTTINNEWDNWYIELYELYPCNTKEELCKREGEVIRLIGNLNCIIAGRTIKEYYQDNKEERLENYKKWYNDNKEYKINYDKDYYELNKKNLSEKISCECGCVITNGGLINHRKTKKHYDLINKNIY
jgi:hypothetical protein